MDRIEERISAHLHGNETADEARELSEWIRERPENAKLFAEMALMHGQLRGLISGEATVRENDLIPDASAQIAVHEKDRRKLTPRAILTVATLAASLLIVVGVTLFYSFDIGGNGGRIANISENNTKVVATLVQSSNAVWEGTSIDAGNLIYPQTLFLRSGFVRLEFIDGVEVTLQGPAEYEVIGIGRTRLLSGLLAATVPPGAEGFQVDTPAAEVIDLGTAFGIELGADGIAKVSVFDGEVEVRPTSSQDKRLVQEGEAVLVTSVNEIESSDFDAIAFEKVWPIASGIVGSTGAFRFAPQWPRRLRFVQSDSEIFVLPEGYTQALQQPLTLNITVPGEYHAQADLTKGELPSGKRVKCFLLQFNPVEQVNSEGRPTGPPDTDDLNPDDLQRIVGEITFDRPILGLIVRGEDLRASDGRFSERGGRVPQKGRALELSGTPRDDFVTLSEDRHTVKLNLAAFGPFSDHVRVIVDQSLVEYE